MIVIGNIKNAYFLFCLLLINISVGVHAEIAAKSYPLPIHEIEEVICDWLTQEGFEVHCSTVQKGNVKVFASKPDVKWQFFLKQDSVLATAVQAEYFGQYPPEPDQAKKLWEHIARYIQPRPISGEDSNQVIPTVVLSKIESVVCIITKPDNKEIQFSGFMIDREGLIISTAHALKNLQDVKVILYNDETYSGQVMKIDPYLDLAIVYIDAEFDTIIAPDKGRNLLGMGEKVYSVGCPINLRGTVFPGIINGPPRRIKDLPFWQVSMKIHPGSSGSPVFDVQGNLVAVVKGRYRGTDSVGFLIPLETIIAFLKEE
ncbi:MAG: trypsin-like peptidase domain-containing protein [Desulfobacterales bacterium]|nr:trypsin-like peptidase domain-containing protein [Desulfobacterales bacterium]